MAKTKPMPGSEPSAKVKTAERLPKRTSNGGTSFWARLWAQRELMLMLIPGVVFFLIFKYGPIYGLRLAFLDYSPFLGYEGSDFVGLDNFKRLFVDNIDEFWRLLGNTLTHTLLSFGTSFPLAIVFALILNEVRMPGVKKAYQTISYLPTFLSGVIIASIFIELFSVKDGIINKVIEALGFEAIPFMNKSWGYYLVYVLSGLWASIGNSAIIYLSALSGVDQEMYEAAEIDGCSRLKRIWYITVPAIMPTIVTMFLINIGHLIRIGADKTLLLRNDLTANEIGMLSTYVYDMNFTWAETSYAATVGFFESVVSAVLLLTFNYIAKKRTGNSIW